MCWFDDHHDNILICVSCNTDILWYNLLYFDILYQIKYLLNNIYILNEKKEGETWLDIIKTSSEPYHPMCYYTDINILLLNGITQMVYLN